MNIKVTSEVHGKDKKIYGLYNTKMKQNNNQHYGTIETGLYVTNGNVLCKYAMKET